jgi:ABC-type Fe3+-hydroxamate transport system substrate-binding protein
VKNLRIVGLIAVTAFLVFFWGCHPNPGITVRDSSGSTVELKKSARRIVSTVPSNTEILYALGLKDRVLSASLSRRKKVHFFSGGMSWRAAHGIPTSRWSINWE